MISNKITMDTFPEYWNEKIYKDLPDILFEKDLPLWGFCKNITQAKNNRKQGVGPRFLKLNGAIIYHKEYLIEWHQSQPKEIRSILHFPKKKKKKTKETSGQMEFIFE